MQDNDGPIFLHSLWRSGSTYLFNVFRRNADRYFAFQEPVHETMLEGAKKRSVLKLMKASDAEWMRHPPLDSGYFDEAYQVHQVWRSLISKPMLYDHYFGGASDETLVAFMSALNGSSEKCVVIQDCRTSGRIGLLRSRLGGTHAYLWRNPWDQWWSYKITSYFPAATQLICSAEARPLALTRWAEAHGFQDYRRSDISTELAYRQRHPLPADAAYQCFFILWALGWIEGRRHADVMIDIDQLSDSATYRAGVLQDLERSGIGGIHLDDCAIFQAPFSETDRQFFLKNEAVAWDFLAEQEDADGALKALREKRSAMSGEATPVAANTSISALSRAREAVVRLENEFAWAAADNERLLASALDEIGLLTQDAREEVPGNDPPPDKLDALLDKAKRAIVGLQEDRDAQTHALNAANDRQRLTEAEYARSLAAISTRLEAQIAAERTRLLEATQTIERIAAEAAIEQQRLKDEGALQVRLRERDLRQSFSALLARTKKEFGDERSRWLTDETALRNGLAETRNSLAAAELRIREERARLAVFRRDSAVRAPAWWFGHRRGRAKSAGGSAASPSSVVQLESINDLSQFQERDFHNPADDKGRTHLTLEHLLSLPASDFVQAAYRFLLGRDGDEGGVDHYTAKLLAGESRITVLCDLRNSAEARRYAEHHDLMQLDGQALVFAVYQRFLKRSPDKGGMDHFLDELAAHGDKRRLIAGVADSEEARMTRSAERRLARQITVLAKDRQRLRFRLARFLFGEGQHSSVNQLGEQLAVLLNRRDLSGQGGTPSRTDTGDTTASFTAGSAKPRRRRRSHSDEAMVDRLMTQIRKDVSSRKSRTGEDGRSGEEPLPPYDEIAAEVKKALAAGA